jgi:hypothetical protein
MRTTILAHTQPLAADATLRARLRPLGTPVKDTEPTIRVGIEGPQGKLYRIIETSSLVEAVRLFETLHDLGLQPGAGRKESGWSVTRVFRAGVA